jgi:hypothetical protein
MLLAIPASIAEDERTFSSVGVTLSQRRTRLELDNLRREHRVRQLLSSAASLNAQAGRLLRIQRANTLLEGFNAAAADLAAAQAPAAEDEPMDIDG